MKTIIASVLILAAVAGCSSTGTDVPYSGGEAASHNSAL